VPDLFVVASSDLFEPAP